MKDKRKRPEGSHKHIKLKSNEDGELVISVLIDALKATRETEVNHKGGCSTVQLINIIMVC